MAIVPSDFKPTPQNMERESLGKMKDARVGSVPRIRQQSGHEATIEVEGGKAGGVGALPYTTSDRLLAVLEGDSVRFTITAITSIARDTKVTNTHEAKVSDTVKLGALAVFELGRIDGDHRFVGAIRFAKAEVHQSAAPNFGPVMERVVPFGAPCDQQCFQFRSGRLFTDGHGPGTTEEQYAHDWKIIEEAGGVDAQALGGEKGFQFVGKGCLFTNDRSPDWEKQTAEEAVKELQHASWITGVIQPKKKDLPLTYLFKTSRGDMGIMQLLGIVESDLGYSGSDNKGHGVKLRYKLVETGPRPTTETKPAPPADPLSDADKRMLVK